MILLPGAGLKAAAGINSIGLDKLNRLSYIERSQSS